jgi:hypothetical protein
MGEVAFFVVAIAVGVLIWWCALRLLRRLYRRFREEERNRQGEQRACVCGVHGKPSTELTGSA